MSRRIRFIPEGGALVEVTCRALQSRLLFRPSPVLNQIIIGTLARAKQRHDKVRVCFFVGLSNHMHILLWVEDAQGLAKFMGYFQSKLAREVGRLTSWKEKIFGRRYQAIVVSNEEKAQVERLRYGLAHGAKEDLVERPRDWPGVHCVRALLEGEVLVTDHPKIPPCDHLKIPPSPPAEGGRDGQGERTRDACRGAWRCRGGVVARRKCLGSGTRVAGTGIEPEGNCTGVGSGYQDGSQVAATAVGRPAPAGSGAEPGCLGELSSRSGPGGGFQRRGSASRADGPRLRGLVSDGGALPSSVAGGGGAGSAVDRTVRDRPWPAGAGGLGVGVGVVGRAAGAGAPVRDGAGLQSADLRSRLPRGGVGVSAGRPRTGL